MLAVRSPGTVAAVFGSCPSTEAGTVSNTSFAGGSARKKCSPLAHASRLNGESPAISIPHMGIRCLHSLVQSLLNFTLH